MAMDSITLTSPFNAHVHLRDGPLLEVAAPFIARQCWGAIVMPNLKPPITTSEQLREYLHEIMDCLSRRWHLEDIFADRPIFKPYLTLYLTESLGLFVIEEAFRQGLAIAVKYYPRGATTNSDEGIRNLEKIFPKLEVMEKIGMPLLLHGEEVVDQDGNEIDPYDREAIFIDNVYWILCERFPKLKISLEHISTAEAATLAKESAGDERYQFTVCPQHLLFDRRDVMRDGNQHDLTCMPRIKREYHKDALRDLIALGLNNVALGSDDAIHPESGKVRATGCNCGCFSSPYTLELYAQVFDEMNALEYLNGFASVNAPRFFGISPEKELIVTLEREEWSPEGLISIPGTDDFARPMGYRANPEDNIVLQWKMCL